jgi:hypothetical protein
LSETIDKKSRELPLASVLVNDGLHYFEGRSLFFDYKLAQLLNLHLLVLFLEFLHGHEAATNADSQGTVSDGRHHEAGAYKVLGVVNSDDGDAEGVLADIGLQEFVDGIDVSRGFVGEGLGEATV